MPLQACKVEEQLNTEEIPETAVSFVIGGDQAITKAGASTNVSSFSTIDLLENNETEGLILTETVTDLDSYYYSGAVETKGTPIYTENFDELVGKFYATVYDENGIKYAPDALFEPRDGKYYYDYKNQLDAISDKSEMLFFFKANVPSTLTPAYSPTTTTDSPLGTISFNYTSPKGTDGNDAESQDDILFTSKKITKGDNSVHKILFYHALTGVKFQNGNAADGKQQIFIKKVVLENIVGSGDCVISPNYTDANVSGTNPSNAKTASASDTKSAQCADWKVGEANSTFSQTFSTTLVDAYGGKGSVPDSFDYMTNTTDGSADKTGANTSYKNLNNASFSQTFMMIPQTLGDKAKVTVYYSFTGEDNAKTYKTSASLKGITWKAGELHTYTLTIEGLAVSITDSVDKTTNVKSNIVTQNTGSTIAYLRCALASNWVYDDPGTSANENVIVAANDALLTGVFVGTNDKPGLSENWLIGSDGYLYYTQPVLPGNSTKYPLFKTYSAPAKTPYKDSHLEINIALQGVQFGENKTIVSSAWKVDKVYVMKPSFTADGVITGLTKTEDTILSKLATTPESAE